MITLAIDIGNTLTKWAVFKNGELVDYQTVECIEPLHIRMLSEQYAPDAYILSSVAKTPDFIGQHLKGARYIPFDYHTPLPIINRYETPETLGLDRLAMAVAAAVFAPQTAALVISAGTCITYDFMTAKGEYIGGAISPGLRMRARALHEFTERLPMVDLPADAPYCAANSTLAIQAGIIKGAQDEVQAKITYFCGKNPSGKIFLTGGDRIYFENSTKNRIFAVSNLVLIGLNEILQHNI